MNSLLKAATPAQIVTIGPVLNADGTAYVTDNLAYGDFLVGKNGTWAGMNANATIAHVANDVQGNFAVTLSSTDVSTFGRLEISLNKATLAAPIYRGTVLGAPTFDALITNAAGAADGLAVSGASKKVAATVAAGDDADAASIKTTIGVAGAGLTGVGLAASQHVIVDSGTVTTLSNLPAAPTDWLTAAAVKADAVTKVQAGLATPTNITAAAGVQLAASQHVIVDSGTVTTVSNGVTLAGNQHVIVDSGTVTTLTNAPGDSSGITTLLSLVGTPANVSISGDIGEVMAILQTNGVVLADSQHVIVDSGTVSTLTNAPGDSSGVTTLLSRIASSITIASGKVAATLAAGDVSGNVAADVQTIKTQTVSCAAGVTVGAYLGNATHAIAVDASGYVTFANTSIASVSGAVGSVTNAVTLAADQAVNVSKWGGTVVASAYVQGNAAQWGGSSLPTFPTNFSLLAISSGGAVTLPTVPEGYGGSISDDQIADIAAAVGSTVPTATRIEMDAHSAQLTAIAAKTALIGGGGRVTVKSSVDPGGFLTINRGYDYLIADGAAIEFQDTGTTWPDFSGGTCHLLLKRESDNSAVLDKTGTVPTARHFIFELTRVETAALSSTAVKYEVLGVPVDGDHVLVAQGIGVVK